MVWLVKFYIFITICVMYSHQSCQYLPGIHINAPNLDEFNGRSESECCGICAQVAECKAYSWNSDYGGTCYLKSVTEPKFLDTSVHTGIKSCAVQPTCHLLPGTHITTANLAHYSGRTETECCDLCWTTAGCQAYSFNYDFGGTCNLKSSVEPQLIDSNVNSGVMYGCL